MKRVRKIRRVQMEVEMEVEVEVEEEVRIEEIGREGKERKRRRIDWKGKELKNRIRKKQRRVNRWVDCNWICGAVWCDLVVCSVVCVIAYPLSQDEHY